jgi:hypothetical protein
MYTLGPRVDFFHGQIFFLLHDNSNLKKIKNNFKKFELCNSAINNAIQNKFKRSKPKRILKTI